MSNSNTSSVKTNIISYFLSMSAPLGVTSTTRFFICIIIELKDRKNICYVINYILVQRSCLLKNNLQLSSKHLLNISISLAFLNISMVRSFQLLTRKTNTKH